MPTQYLSGKPYPRAVDPVQSKIANGRGLYPWSAFYAPLARLIDEEILADSDLAGEVVALLLFTADIPVIAHGFVCGTEGRYNIAGVQNLLTLPAAFIGDAPSGVVGPVVLTNYGEVLKGYTAAVGPVDGVAVSGFPAQFYNPIQAPLSETVTGGVVQPDSAVSVSLSCIANGAVACGVVGNAFFGKPNSFSAAAPTPTILLASDYTQAIKDNGNLLIDGAGNLAQIVGLYYIT